MYPNLYFVFKDLFNLDLPFLRIINTFGFFVAIAFLLTAWLLVIELRRRQALGLFTYTEVTEVRGEPASIGELVSNFILGFVLGYKIIGIFLTEGALNDPQTFLFSSQGSMPAGLLVGALLAGLKWYEKHKQRLAKPEKRTIRVWPADKVGDITILAAISGFAGAKVFDNLENWDRFIQDPIGNLFAPSGLTFYGGLIVAAIALAIYFRKQKIKFINFADAVAPGMMLAYSVGRMGCQFAGDGDWGIYNSAYAAKPDGSVQLSNNFAGSLQQYHAYFLRQHPNLESVPHASFAAPSWLPDWMFAYTYPHNVNMEGVRLANCTWGEYCNYLPIPVFPTPFYEIVVAGIMFLVLWAIRKRFVVPGRLFAVYLVMNGVERFLVEKIRVNNTYDFGSFQPTQAELISTFLVVTGIVLYAMAPKWFGRKHTV